jgi:hypothetical protein
MVNVLVGLLLGVFVGLALRPVIDAYVWWRAANELERQDVESAAGDHAVYEERDR